MFSVADRERLRDSLIVTARANPGVVGAALVGSAATGREDAWSDIDLALQISSDAEPSVVADRWTAELYARHGAAHHLDVVAGGVLYRVFLLASSLQVDISFWPEDQFHATEPGFTVLFGTPNAPAEPKAVDVSHVVGMAWLYGLHARSAIARGRTWQAIMMLDHLRDQILVMACLRHGLNPHHGREADLLPQPVLAALDLARATSASSEELTRSHAALLQSLTREIALHDTALSERLAAPLSVLSRARR